MPDAGRCTFRAGSRGGNLKPRGGFRAAPFLCDLRQSLDRLPLQRHVGGKARHRRTDRVYALSDAFAASPVMWPPAALNAKPADVG